MYLLVRKMGQHFFRGEEGEGGRIQVTFKACVIVVSVITVAFFKFT